MFLTAVAAQSCGGGNVFIDWGLEKTRRTNLTASPPLLIYNLVKTHILKNDSVFSGCIVESEAFFKCGSDDCK